MEIEKKKDIPLSQPAKPSPEYPDRFKPFVYAVVQVIFKICFKVIYRAKVFGQENVPKEGPLLVASNHASHFDPPALGSLIHRPMRFMAKQELFGVPVFGTFIQWLGAMPVTRGGADRRAVQAIAATLRSGNAVMIFPEGTRTSDGELQEPKTGIGWLAANIEDSLILPVYIGGTYGIWSRHRKYPGRGRVEIHIGKPVRPSELVPALAQLKSATRKSSSENGEEASEGEKENLAGGAKKRLYWELAVEIMGQIAKVKKETSR